MLFRKFHTRFILGSTGRRIKNITAGNRPAILASLAVLALLSACTSVSSRPFAAVPGVQFQEDVTPTGNLISLESAGDEVPDTDILFLGEEITALLDQSVLPIADPDDRLDAVIEILNQKVRYDTMTDKYATKTAVETYNTGTGNCLSFANLFVAMARYAGFEAGYQEVSTTPNWTREGGVLFVSKHISATAAIDAFYDSDVELVFANNDEVIIHRNRHTDRGFSLRSRTAYPGEEAVRITPIPDYRAFAQYYNNIASMHLAEGDAPLAFRYYIKSIKTDPSLYFVWSNLGVAYSRNSQWAPAEEAFLQALSITRKTNDIAALSIMNNMVKLYERSGNEESARFYREEVAAFREKNPYFHYLAGQSAYSDASYEKSVKYFKAAIRRKENDDLFYYSLAMAYLKLGEMKKAERNIDKAKSYTWDDQTKKYYDHVLEKISGVAIN